MKRKALATLAWLALAVAAAVGIDAWPTSPSPRFERMPATPWLVLDRQLGLVWQRCPRGTQLVDDARQPQCTGKPDWLLNDPAAWEAQRIATPREAWRLPEVRELASLVDDRRCCHALDPLAFPLFGVPADGSWGGRIFPFHTARPLAHGGDQWRVESLEGEVKPVMLPQSRALLRLVRTASPAELAR